MARVTLWVPDDLKAAMQRRGGHINWSGTFQKAIIAELRSDTSPVHVPDDDAVTAPA